MRLLYYVVFVNVLFIIGVLVAALWLSFPLGAQWPALNVIITLLLGYLIFGTAMSLQCGPADLSSPLLLPPAAAKNSSPQRPKVIYGYWDDPSHIPPTVARCFASWRQHNPHYEIVILDASHLSTYLEAETLAQVKTLSPQLVADLLRLTVLAHSGGVWLDASILLNEPLDWLESPALRGREFVGFHLEQFASGNLPQSPVVESWFLAAAPHSAFMQDWLATFKRLLLYPSVEAYVGELGLTTDFQAIDDPVYLAIHSACQFVLQHPNCDYSLALLRAEDGPFLHKSTLGFNPVWFPLFFLMWGGLESPIVKYTKTERRILEFSGLHRYLP